MIFLFVITNQHAENMVYFILGISLSRGNKALMKFIFLWIDILQFDPM